MITFGPIPSRRPGQSLGINNIPHKPCSYSVCIASWDAHRGCNEFARVYKVDLSSETVLVTGVSGGE